MPPICARLTVADGTVLEVVAASPRRVRSVRVHRVVAPKASESDDGSA